ncbi:MAG: secretin and TonB N-terminal domain-containing protein [Candidatus Marinimicrobia bacterium]|nr:secretin and TonB N-terminal domain-containing protein [Candidatus Neomarinimicrobiota bacterium]
MKRFNMVYLLVFLMAGSGSVFSQVLGTVAAQEKANPTLITIHAEDAYLPSILSILAEESGYNIVTDPNVSKMDQISIHLDNVPIEQAINLVVRAVGLSYEVVGNSFLVADPKKLAKEVGITSRVIELKYAEAQEVKNFLSDLTKQIQVDISGNKILVNASPKKIAEIEEVIRQIDVPAIQIQLETRLIEIGIDDEENLGIDWDRLAQYTTILAENGVPAYDGGGSWVHGMAEGAGPQGQVPAEFFEEDDLDLLPDKLQFNRLYWNDLNDQNLLPHNFSRQMQALDLTLDMLIKQNKAEILANTKLVTLNGREAEIKMIDIVPYILSSGGVGGQVQVQREEVGVKLNILPTVNTDGYITVRVVPEVSTIFEFIGPDKNIPRVKSRQSFTTIRVKDGETIIIGGLISRDKKATEWKFPGLYRIPWLGKKLFTSTDLIDRKTDLIIQITPTVIKDVYSGIEKTGTVKDFEVNTLEEFYKEPEETGKGEDHEK